MNIKHLRKYWQLFWLFRKLRLMVMMEHRNDFFFWSFVSIMWTMFNFFFYSLILRVNGHIAGWTSTQMYILLSTFSILDAFTWSLFYPNMGEYTRKIFSGELSPLLTKPVDLQYLVSLSENSYTNTFRFLIGIGALVWSLHQAAIHPSFWQALEYIALLCLSLLFIYSIWFIIATCAFWVEKLDNINEIIPSSRQMWQIPRSVYTGIASTLFTVVLPLGLISSIPSEVFVAKNSLFLSLYFFIFTVTLFFLSRWFLRFSLRKYSSVGN